MNIKFTTLIDILVKSNAKGILVVYVDDILVSSSDLVEIEEVKEYVKRQF